MKVHINLGPSNIDLRHPRQVAELRRCLSECFEETPDAGEGIVVLGRTEHYFTYSASGDTVEVNICQRDVAENSLNARGLTTYPRSGVRH
jgi:hypothetical protein